MTQVVKGCQNACCSHIDACLHKFPCVCLAFVAQDIDEGFVLWLQHWFLTIGHKNRSFEGVVLMGYRLRFGKRECLKPLATTR